MNDVTPILSRFEAGDLSSSCQLVYVLLRKVKFALNTPDDDLLALDDDLSRLADENDLCANLVKLRFFAGLSLREAAAPVQHLSAFPQPRP
jgi:hypothetical protein